MKALFVVGIAVILTGCAYEPGFRKAPPDQYSLGTAWINGATTLQEAQARADKLCREHGKVRGYNVPEFHMESVAKQQEERGWKARELTPLAWAFPCTEEEMLRWRAENYKDPASIASYRAIQQKGIDEASKKAEEDYQLLRRLAKQKGVESNSRVLSNGTIISETYGNGRLCTGVSDEFGSSMSCEDVN